MATSLIAGRGSNPLCRGIGLVRNGFQQTNHFIADATRTFGEEQGLSPDAQRACERRLEAIDAEEIVAASASAELIAFDDLGHRKILYAPPVVRAAGASLLHQHRCPVPISGV